MRAETRVRRRPGSDGTTPTWFVTLLTLDGADHRRP